MRRTLSSAVRPTLKTVATAITATRIAVDRKPAGAAGGAIGLPASVSFFFERSVEGCEHRVECGSAIAFELLSRFSLIFGLSFRLET